MNILSFIRKAANSVVYVAAADGKLYAADAATGRVLFRAAIGDCGGGTLGAPASPTVDEGDVYISCYDGSAVMAFALRGT